MTNELSQHQLDRLEDEAIDGVPLDPDDAVRVFDHLHTIEAELKEARAFALAQPAPEALTKLLKHLDRLLEDNRMRGFLHPQVASDTRQMIDNVRYPQAYRQREKGAE